MEAEVIQTSDYYASIHVYDGQITTCRSYPSFFVSHDGTSISSLIEYCFNAWTQHKREAIIGAGEKQIDNLTCSRLDFWLIPTA
jgi:hypothetical protein